MSTVEKFRQGQLIAASPKHVNGTASGTAAAVNLLDANVREPDWFTIQSLGPDDLLLSFDDGTTFATLAPSTAFDLENPGRTITLKADGTSAVYEIVATYRRFNMG